MIETLCAFFCRHFHGKLLRPANGKYVCATCLRVYPVEWPVAERWARPQVDSATDSAVLSVEG